MPLRRQFHKASFHTKVLVPVVACMVGLVAATFFIIDFRIKQQAVTEGQSRLETAENEFQQLQQDRAQNFLLRFQNLPRNQPWIALFRQNDAKNLQASLNGLMAEARVHVVLYTSASKGVLDCEVRNPMVSEAAFEAAAAPSVHQAMLQGDKPTDTVLAGGQLYDIVSIPAYNGNELLGVLTLGSELDASAARELSQLTHGEIVLLANGRVITSTLSGQNADAQFVSLFTNSPAAGEADVKPVVLHDEHYFSVAGRFQSLNGDRTLGYVLLSSYEKPLQALLATQKVLLGVSFCAILIGTAIVWFLIGKATRPLRELRDSAEAVGRGDFSRRVPVRGRDECGELAVVFNQMTENLQQSRAELEKTVETLKGTQAQLIQSEKLSAVGEFVAGVAHELNNPLTAVMGFSEMLKDADVSVKYRRYLEMIFKSAQRCQKIVQSLLAFARRHQPERKPVSVNAMVEAVLEMLQYQLRTSNIEVVTQFDPTLPIVLADDHQIQQVLLNVINNARQAIEGFQPKGQIKITTEADGRDVRVVIQDNGPGIPAKNLRLIFDPFFTTKQVGKGTGLGLSLCYGIIKEHGGAITPASQPGGGATFVIQLPIVHLSGDTTAMFRAAAAGGTDLSEGAGKKILVIDDEEIILEMLREELTSHGYEVDVAATGEAGLRRLKQNHCDVVFCDWKMPGLNGRQVYENLRTASPALCQRVVFITGDVVNEQMRGFLAQERRFCLAKPFTFDEVRDAIKTVLTTA
jgi:signal transduction histidine kinase